MIGSSDSHSRSRVGLAVLLALGAASCSERPVRSGILITLDTTNPDALDCYASSPGVSPRLAELAAESVVYDQAHAVAPITLPAHASMLTGLYPLRHGVRDNGLEALPQSALTLAERAQAAGLETAAFVSATVLAAPFGLDQGFDVYDAPSEASTSAVRMIAERGSSDTLAAALRWLSNRDRERPFFLWVHFFDPHFPYEPAPQFLAQGRGVPYLGEVATMDASIGELVAKLRSEGVLDEALLVVLADHGEGLGRNAEPTHSTYCYETTLHIPLLVRHPHGFRAGTRSDRPASSVDVFPTFVEALALGERGEVDGRSLAREDPPADRGIYFESYVAYLAYGWSPLAGWIQGDSKYVHGSSPRLYDLARDPEEQTNLIDGSPGIVASAREGIRAIAALPALARGMPSTIDEKLRAQVRELGYAAFGDAGLAVPHPLEPCTLPDPYERKTEFVALNQALALSSSGRRGEAIELLRELLGTSPENPSVLLNLGSMLVQEKRQQEALEVFTRLLDLSPTLPSRQAGWIHGFLASMHEAARRLEEAAKQYGLGLKLDPANVERRKRLARVLQALGREEEARALFESDPASGGGK